MALHPLWPFFAVSYALVMWKASTTEAETEETRMDTIMAANNLVVSFFGCLGTAQLIQEYNAAGNPDPTSIVGAHPSSCMIFVLINLFGFVTSLLSLLTKPPKISRVLSLCSNFFIFCAAVMLTAAAIWITFSVAEQGNSSITSV